jgi:hypothetical protein
VQVAKLVSIGIVALTLATACGSSGQAGFGHHSLSQVKNAFAAQGIPLQKQSPQPPPAPGSGAVWLTAAGGTLLVGVFKSSQDSAYTLIPGHPTGHEHVVHDGNVVVICQGRCAHAVTLSLQQLQ